MKSFHKKIFLSSPHMGGSEQEFINSAFQQNWIAPLGENVDCFEKELGEYCNVENASVLTSGTAALHLALILLGVKKDDEVMCQSFTFCASANPIMYLLAKPVFVGSEASTWNMCPEQLELGIKDRIRNGKKPKAVILVHLYGMPAEIEKIVKVCENYDIPLIEDAAESLGSTYKNRMTGTFGEFGIFSFNGNKIITSSGGGALIGKSKKMIDKSRFLATQARDPSPFYLHSEVGYNYRMSNIVAGIGRGQLKVLNDRVKARQENYEFYQNHLASTEVSFLQSNQDGLSNRWLTTLILGKNILKEISVFEVCKQLQDLNVECRPLWNPLHLQPVFSDCLYFGEKIEENLFSSGLCLPSGSNLALEEKEFVVAAFKSIVGAF